MTSRKPARRFAALFVLVLSLAAVVWTSVALGADGDDDTSFDGDGAVYVPIGEESNASSTFAGELSNGNLVAAVMDWRPNFRGDSDTTLKVAVVAPGGTVLDDGAPGIELPSGGGELFDLRVLEDDTVVVVGYLFNDPGRRLFAVVMRPGGPVTVSFADHGDCGRTPPEAARIRPDGGVVGAWDDCEEPFASLVQRFALDENTDQLEDADAFLTTVVGGEAVVRVRELSLHDDGDIFVVGIVDDGGTETVRGISGSAVQRWTEDGDRVADYGDSGTASFPDFAGGLDVGDDGRAVVALRAQSDEWSFLSFTPGGDPDPEFGATARGAGGDGRVDLNDDELCCEGATSLIVQPDGKVLAFKAIDNDGSGIDPTIIARLSRDGTLDDTFAGDGVRVFEFDNTRLYSEADPVLLRDGRVIAPSTASRFDEPGARVGEPADRGYSMALYRLGDAPAPPPPPPPAPASPAAVTAPVVTAPSQQAVPRTCRSRRRFTIRLRTGRRKAERSPIVSARVTVNGKRVQVSRRARRTAQVALANLPRGRFTVRITLRLKDGGVVRETRRYRTCAQKIERELGPLRTRPPGSGRRG